ncbi:hypothetical protein AAG906_026355 [Vitis piasezkii]
MSPEAIFRWLMVTALPIEVLPPFTSALMDAMVSLRLDMLQRLYTFHTSQLIQQIFGSGPLYLRGTWSTSYPEEPLSIQSFYVRSFHLGCS